ncbi:hypothetical protein BKA70DRAFT_1178804 [Coprinopsis sp. MPI-PUGE-AT-0042]|nr:hypothetical protein BKA70DRAFT_1178804 [Coprinopsis sp. MPI-PUGE-AT-0042]
MTLAHDFFNTRNLQQFQKLLDGAANDRKQPGPAQPSTSGGKSWSRPSALASMTPTVDVNARDSLGRTVLHLACTGVENIEYVRVLLKHSSINVNLPDTESHWTPLHRAMYNANLPVAQLLLQRSDIDVSIKDFEGYTAFDLYNSTINGTKPDANQEKAELYTWGANRNAALGHGDGNDRVNPDQVVIQSKEDPETLADYHIVDRFTPISIHQAQMSKLHTVVVTSEDRGNLRLCGFGSGGRLGPGQHTQYSFKPLSQLTSTVISVALGQDHSLALTKAGEVLSWGLNRFSQLGYVIESPTGKHEEPIQPTPKKIFGPLKKEVVIGVAASKNASACWTVGEVFTWGTNTGHLGYDKSAQPIQILPRKVTKFSQPIISLALSEHAMVGLLQTQQVECVWNDRHYRINFPIHAFPSEIQPFRPRQAIKDSHVAKVTSCGDLFAALSFNGEVFTFSPPQETSDGNDSHHSSKSTFKPQRVWALRKKFSAVKDVALSADGSIIICTESGHVYARIRTSKGGAGKNFKFQRVPYLQRVTRVCSNGTGAFGALRVDFKAKKIIIQGPSISEDLAVVEPFRRTFPVTDTPPGHRFHPEDTVQQVPLKPVVPGISQDDDIYMEDELDDIDIEKDVATLHTLLGVLRREQQKAKRDTESPKTKSFRLPYDADTLISVGNLSFPVHRVVLAARSSVLSNLLAGKSLSKEWKGSLDIHMGPPRPGPGRGVLKVIMLTISGIHPLSLLILLHYLYSDEVLAIWDRRIFVALMQQTSTLKGDVTEIKADLVALADALGLKQLEEVLQAPVKRAPRPTLSADLATLLSLSQDEKQRPPAFAPDVVLELKDWEVRTHSVILRVRSEYFASLFGEEVWTRKRWGADGVLRVDLKHLRWHVMEYVLNFLLCGRDAEIFEVLPFTKTVEDVLEFMFEVMAAAAELLLDRLILICSSVTLSFLNIHNCCYILAEATHYQAHQLIDSVQEYMAANMESLLEVGMLDDLPYFLTKQLSRFIQARQLEKSSFSRTDAWTDSLMAKHWDWLETQDIPAPSVKNHRSILPKDRARPSPPPTKDVVRGQSRGQEKERFPSDVKSPIHAVSRKPSGDDLFAMDLGEGSNAAGFKPATPSAYTIPAPAWKVADAPRVDMRTLMAEAQQAARPSVSSSPKYTPGAMSMARTPSGSGSRLVSGVEAKVPPSPGTPTKTPAQSGTAWRQNSVSQTISTSSTPLTSPFPTKGPAPPSSSPLRTPTRKPSGPSPLAPGMGPTFTPTKQITSKPTTPTVRSVSGGKAWTAPPPEPTAQLTSPKSLSFAEIQQAQEQRSAPVKDRRSLKEIQEEEESIQQEVDFMKWWQEEEARVQNEMAALQAFSPGGSASGSGRGRGGGRNKGKGRGAEPRSGKPQEDMPTTPGPSNTPSRPKENQSRRPRPPKAEGTNPQGETGSESRPRPRRPPKRQPAQAGPEEPSHQ